jgi:peptidoglycan/xylan/chitin deacetylase (PgdA/CDA1 family)
MNADWILTFDDGPLPADITDLSAHPDGQALAPLKRIIEILGSHSDGPIPAVFFLRGPAFPWKPEPPRELFEQGVRMILDAGHFVGLHCHRHDPRLWWSWALRGSDIRRDLDRCVEYFTPMVGAAMTCFRPPYGQGGGAARRWADTNRIRYHLMDVDTQDWLHHPDNRILPLFRRNPSRHLAHMMRIIPLNMYYHMGPAANDVLLHVSFRTADHLTHIIECIVKTSESHGRRARFVVPPEYLAID